MDDEPDLFDPIRRDEIGEIVAGFGFLFLWIPALLLLAAGWHVLAAVCGVMWVVSMPLGMWLDSKL